MLRIGQTFTLTNDAIENYGEQYRDVIFVVTHAANEYMPAEQFFAQGRPDGFHPGYDESVSPQGLYDSVRQDTGEEIGFSVYDWEIQ